MSAASAARSAFPRQVPPRSRDPGRPPPVSQFGTCDPASDASSLPGCLHGGARPERRSPSALHGRGEMGHAPPVDFCHRKRTTSTTVDALNPAEPHPRMPPRMQHSRRVDLAVARRTADGNALASAASRDVTGQGSCARREATRSTFTTAIARGGDLAPTRSARTPVVAADTGPGSESSQAVAAPSRELPYTRRQAHREQRAVRVAGGGPPRRGPRSAAPEVPSIDGRTRRSCRSFHSLSPGCGLRATPLAIFAGPCR